jgi:hypothetical protein
MTIINDSRPKTVLNAGNKKRDKKTKTNKKQKQTNKKTKTNKKQKQIKKQKQTKNKNKEVPVLERESQFLHPHMLPQCHAF